MADSTSILASLLLTTLQSAKEAAANALFNSASQSMLWALNPATTTGLTFGLIGGRYNSASVSNQTVSLTTATTNYIVAARATGTVSVSTATTNWDNQAAYIRLYKVVAGASTITSYEDHRQTISAAAASTVVGQIPQNSQSAAYTTVLSDAGLHIFHPSADTSARTWTIDSNANVAYPIGTAITFVNQNGAGIITIAITSDTMRLAGAGTTGSRSLAANGIATALKVTSTEWIISGTGLT